MDLSRFATAANENAARSPVAGFYDGFDQSEWGSPPACPIAESTPGRKALARSVSLQNATPPPVVPRPAQASCDGLYGPSSDSAVSGGSGLKPNWARFPDAVCGMTPRRTGRELDSTPLPARRSTAHLDLPPTPHSLPVGPTPRPWNHQQSADEAGLDDGAWAAYYADQQRESFISPQSTHFRGTNAPILRMPQTPRSPGPRTLADVPDLPPVVEYDPMTALDSPPPAASVIGVRPRRTQHALPPTGGTPPPLDHRARRQNHQTARRGVHAEAAFDSLLDRIAAQDDVVVALPPPVNDSSLAIGLQHSPASTELDRSPYESNARQRAPRLNHPRDVAVADAAFVTMDADEGHESPARGATARLSGRRRVVAVVGAAGLLVTAGAFITLGATGLLG
jgi:hypothetical protein